MKKVALIAFAFGAFCAAQGQENETLMLRAAERIFSPDVAADIQLSAPQQAEGAKLFSDFQDKKDAVIAKFQAGPANGADAANSTITKLKIALDSHLLGILKPAQVARLKEIGIQDEGSEALLDAEIASEVGLTSEQRSKIKAVFDKVDEAESDYQVAM